MISLPPVAPGGIRLRGVEKEYRVRTVGGRELKDLVRMRLHREVEHFQALRGVDLDVEPGESLGVIGRNGAGKSTLLKLVAGTSRPDRGTVEAPGRVSALLELGAGFHPEFSGRENVQLNAALIGMPRRELEARFDDIVSFSGVGRFIDQPVKTYSSGMFVRLAFSVAVHTDPQILLVDEVLAVGDEAFQNRCLERVRELRRRGVTIVFVSHDESRVKATCDRAIWIDNGLIRLDGASRRVCDHYLEAVLTHLAGGTDEVRAEYGDDTRWGTGEASVEALALTREGEEVRDVTSGAPVTIRVDYRLAQPLEDPVLGVGIFRSDGIMCWGSNTSVEGLSTGRLDGGRRLTVDVESLALIPGEYYLDAGIHSAAGHFYDYRHGSFRFRVVPDGRPDEGILRPVTSWRLEAR